MSYGLPTTVTVGDRIFHISKDGDFRMVLDCFEALQDEEMSEDYRVLASLLIFYNELNSYDDVAHYKDILKSLVEEMYLFINCGQPQSPGAVRDKAILDWTDDSQMICAAVNNVAKTEVRALEYLHWWTFMGYFMSVGKSVLATVVSIRDKIAHNKKLEKWEKEFKRDNIRYFARKQTKEEREADDLVRELWNKGGGK